MRKREGGSVRPGAVCSAIGVACVLQGGWRGKALLIDAGIGLIALGLAFVLSGLLLRRRATE